MDLQAQERGYSISYWHSFIVHNLCCERPIPKKISVFSSCLIELQYGVARSVIYSGPNCPFSGEREKRGRFYSL